MVLYMVTLSVWLYSFTNISETTTLLQRGVIVEFSRCPTFCIWFNNRDINEFSNLSDII